MVSKKGILLINLGTPDHCDVSSVRKYLKEFLLDPYVVDIPALFRWMLVYGVILPFRPAKSAHAYQKVWLKEGSPLLVHSKNLKDKLQKKLSSTHQVELAMRYGNPSLTRAKEAFQRTGVSEILVIPLYPQYSLAATESSLQKTKKVFDDGKFKLKFIEDFYQDKGFISAFLQQIQKTTQNFKADHTVFSFHGLPERQIKKTDSTQNHCLVNDNCCDGFQKKNPKCYRAQCFLTANLLAHQMNLSLGDFSVGFQSRLGRTPWIKPYTDILLSDLAKKGVKRLVVVSPSFVADCLETLEEIQIRGKEQFIAEGGEDLKLVPSLNSEDSWVGALEKMINSHTSI